MTKNSCYSRTAAGDPKVPGFQISVPNRQRKQKAPQYYSFIIVIHKYDDRQPNNSIVHNGVYGNNDIKYTAYNTNTSTRYIAKVVQTRLQDVSPMEHLGFPPPKHIHFRKMRRVISADNAARPP